MRCSSKRTQQPLVKNAGAITLAESESVNATKPSCRHLLLPFHRRCCYTSNLSILHVNWHAKGRPADAADTESFSYTRTTKALLCLTVCLSLTRCSQPPLPPFPRPSRPRDSLTSFTKSSVSCPDLTHLHPLTLIWGQKTYYLPLF